MVADPQLVHLVSALLRTNYERLKSETILYGDLDGSLKVESLDDPGRIVAIVVNDESGREEGSLFVLKYADHATGSLKIELVIPILEDFVFTLGQANNDTSERDGDEETPEGMYTSGEMQVTFGGAGQSITLRTVAREAIRFLSVESRRLKAIAEKNRFIESGSHSWLRLYTTRRSVNRVFSYEQYLRSAYPPPKLSIAYAGMPGDELTDSELICDEWIRGQLHNRLGEYGTTQSISIRLGTFNVNGKDPSGTLSSWIGCGDNKERPLPDVLVFGFQELDLSAETLLYSTSTLKEEKWCKSILDNLGQDADSYVKLTSKQLVGMLIFVLVRKTLRHHMSEISSASSGQGAMWLGNKGGVALRLRIYDTVFVFVNSHLAAFDNMVERRNADYSELRRLLRFPLPPDLFGEPSMFGPNAGVFDSDFTFWMGDQNYRIDLPDQDVRQLLQSIHVNRDASEVLEFDQLLFQRHLGRCFTELEEGKITFLPTYRFELGTRELFAYDIKRRPAYTDRIFYRAGSHLSINQMSYTSYMDVCLSDHKPVAADFVVETRRLEVDKLFIILDGISSVTRKLFDDSLGPPNVVLSAKEIDFGRIFYSTGEIREIALTNNGEGAAFYRFVSPSETSPLCPRWLTISPEYGLILPGESAAVRFKVMVDNSTASRFNRGLYELSDTLILHIAGGQDYFLPIFGQYQRTCFANELTWLSRLPAPIRKVDMRSDKMRKEDSAPREVVRILDWLMDKGAAQERTSLFLNDGNMKTVQAIRECLDTGDPFPVDGDSLCSSMARTLLEFMRSLPEPIIPWGFHSECANVGDRAAAFEIMERLPRSIASVWLSIISFLSYVAGDDVDHPVKLADKFAPVLLRNDPAGSPQSWISPIAKRQFILYFMQ